MSISPWTIRPLAGSVLQTERNVRVGIQRVGCPTVVARSRTLFTSGERMAIRLRVGACCARLASHLWWCGSVGADGETATPVPGAFAAATGEPRT